MTLIVIVLIVIIIFLICNCKKEIISKEISMKKEVKYMAKAMMSMSRDSKDLDLEAISHEMQDLAAKMSTKRGMSHPKEISLSRRMNKLVESMNENDKMYDDVKAMADCMTVMSKDLAAKSSIERYGGSPSLYGYGGIPSLYGRYVGVRSLYGYRYYNPYRYYRPYYSWRGYW